MRYDSVAQAPRSIILQRSEQKGRHLFSGANSASSPQCGQGTLVFTGLDGAESEVEAHVALYLAWPLVEVGFHKTQI